MKSIVSLAHVQVGDVRVNLSGRNVRMAQQRLHRTRIRAVLHQMRAKAVTQSVRRDIRHAGLGRISLDDRPRRLSGHLAVAMQEQLGPRFIPQSLANAEITLNPVYCAFTDRNATLLAAFAMTGKQSGVDLNIARLQSAHFRNSQARGIQYFEHRSIAHTDVGLEVGRIEQTLHLFLTQKLGQARSLLRRVNVFGRVAFDVTVQHQEFEEAAGGAHRPRH